MARAIRKAYMASTVLPLALFAAGSALAQTTSGATTASSDLDEVVVTGLRGQPRTVTDSPVPVDVFSADEVERAGQTDTLNVLQTLVPSYSVRRAANTTSDTFIRAPTMRGLAADQTLLLVNSRRRHKSASVGVSGYGSQAADAAVIPSIAIKSVEVLRDGAAAQYGSDAIAGVINFNLKDASSGGSLIAQGGQYYQGDGDDYLVAGNIGLPLTDHGFINISGQWHKGDRTIRSAQFTSSSWNAVDEYATNPVFRAAVGNLSEPLERVGKPIEDDLRFVVNSGIDLSADSELYGFANYSKSKGTAAATYRVPGAGHQVMDNPIRLSDGTEWRFKDLYPGGLRPDFSGKVTDWSAAGGYRTKRELSGGQSLSADVGLRYGWDKIAYSMVNTVNPSMGPDSPLHFEASSYISSEFAANADFVYETPLDWLAKPLSVNFGAEYRKETFEIQPGEPNSYTGGTWSTPDPFDFCTDESDFSLRTLRSGAPTNAGINCASASDPVYNILQPGSNGITGLSPDVSGTWSTSSYSVYLEGAADVTDRWFVDLATRYENYESFGSKVIAKAATRFQITDAIAVRGSIGSGFRAPTAGQLNMTQTQISTSGGVPLNIGLYPASNPVSVYLGAKPLGPETSTNYSVGLTFTPFSRLTVTVDAYQIDLKDQIYATSQITVTPAIEAAMVAAGIAGAGTIDRVNFFQNAFDSRVKGVDVVGSYRYLWDNGQTTSIVGSFNYNSYKIRKVNISTVTFNKVSVFNFENNNPDWRANVTFTHEIGPVTAMLRANVFGPYQRQTTASGNAIQKYDTEVQWDSEVEYKMNEKLSFAIGGRNIFDNYPAINVIDQTNGRLYVDGPVDWQGGFYYGRITYNF
ncbi:TonB-dependent receptor plug domain-containing protein [Phenylobacterium sp.]|uniref:TonB-dependent receptor plug domain-containing protein n=1 Tax=Phenylobacterium sp. TaxID=1871053 RepID=UPI0035B495DD